VTRASDVPGNAIVDDRFLEDRLMTRGRSGPEAGFSLVELLIALTITLIVSGAIYGLLAGGQNAFRREPELTDRQQNARIAMNLIMRDIANAGTGMSAFTQTFTTGLDGPTGAPNNAAGQPTDELEILTNNSGRDNEPVCGNGASNATNVATMRNLDVTFLPLNTPVLLIMEPSASFRDGSWGFRNVTAVTPNSSGPTGGSPTCAGSTHAQLGFSAGSPPGLNGTDACLGSGPFTSNPVPPTDCRVSTVNFGSVVRYRIRNDAAGVPVLQRWSSDDYTNFTAAGAPDTDKFEEVARGIEDLQVRYAIVAPTTASAWEPGGAPTVTLDDPAVLPDANDYRKLIVKVEVKLTARAEGRQIAGGSGADAKLRGDLVSVGTPRATLIHLANIPADRGGPQWR
jgi:type IV pilus assembly protein PilW